MKHKIYMDYAAATPLDPDVFKAMQPYFYDKFYNPSASYLEAHEVKNDLEKARRDVASILGAKSSEIVFTAGGTEANNLAIRGVLEQFPNSHVVTSAIEHESVLGPAALFNHKLASVSKDGIIDISKLIDLINDKTLLVSVMYANNEVGSIQPIRQLAQSLQTIRLNRQKKHGSAELPLYFHVDACQAAGYLDLHVSSLGVDLMSINGGKIYGPKQSGVLFISSQVKLQPLILGGGQEHNYRSGTENVAGSMGLAQALNIVQSNRREENARLTKLRDLFIEKIQSSIPNCQINGSLKHRLPNNVHITIPGQDNERLLYLLNDAGILAAAGSACSALRDETSHVLKAMGVSDEQARSSLRFSFGKYTTEPEVIRSVNVLTRLVA